MCVLYNMKVMSIFACDKRWPKQFAFCILNECLKWANLSDLKDEENIENEIGFLFLLS